MDVVPNQTLYVSNLNEKVQKEGRQEESWWRRVGVRSPPAPRFGRPAKVTLLSLLAARPGARYRGPEDKEDEGPGLCRAAGTCRGRRVCVPKTGRGRRDNTRHPEVEAHSRLGSGLRSQDIACASRALKALEGFPFYDRPLVSEPRTCLD